MHVSSDAGVLMAGDSSRMTVELPSDLIEAADRAVEAGHAQSRDDLVALALRRQLRQLVGRHPMSGADLAAAFVRMGADPEVRAEALQLDREFAAASWEAFRSAEDESAEAD